MESPETPPSSKRRRKNADNLGVKDSAKPPFITGWITKIGGRQENQDDYLVLSEDPFQQLPLWAVFDGHGVLGGKASKEAKKIAESLSKMLLNPEMTAEDIEQSLKNIVRQIDLKLLELAEQAKEDEEDYGTTAILATLSSSQPPKLIVASVGDSRAVLFRFGNSCDSIVDIFELSKEHSVFRNDEYERIKAAKGMVVHGRVTPASGFSKEIRKKKKLGLNMSRALGHKILRNYGVSSIPELDSIEIRVGDKLVIASDGLWDFMNNKEVGEFIINYVDAQKATKDLCRQVELRTKQTIADNITIIAVFF